MVNKRGRPSKDVFKNFPNPEQKRFSVNWEACSTIDETLQDYPNHGVVRLSAQLCWGLEQTIERSSKDWNAAHCNVLGEKPEEIREQFALNAEWVRRPPGTSGTD